MVIITLWLQVLKTSLPPIRAEDWRNFLVMRVERWLPGDEGVLAAGMLWGGSEGLSRQTKEAYRRVGLLHIVAASGYNVTLVTGWILSSCLIWLSRRWALGVTMIGVVIYMAIAGWQPSIIRAGIMAILAMTGLILGRERDAKWLLIVTGVAMLVWNRELISDIGFQLSFAATWGILWLMPQRSMLKAQNSITTLFAADLKTTLAAQAMTTPLILHHFGNLSMISPLVNATLLWTVPLIMQITAAGLVWGPINYLAWPLLRMQTWVVSSVATWPISNFEMGKMSWGWVGVYYLVLYICLKFWPWRRRLSG